MTAYVLFDVKEVIDGDKLEEYRSLVLETVTLYGGRYLLLGGTVESLEGSWLPKFPVLIQFPNREAAANWYNSDPYRYPKSLRMAGANCDAVLIESVPNEFTKE